MIEYYHMCTKWKLYIFNVWTFEYDVKEICWIYKLHKPDSPHNWEKNIKCKQNRRVHIIIMWTVTMQSLNIKAWTVYRNQTPSKHFDQIKISKLNTPPPPKYSLNVDKIGGAHIQCANSNYAKFEYRGLNTFGVTVYTNRHPQGVADGRRDERWWPTTRPTFLPRRRR